MTVKELQEEILRLKAEKDICILAHAYQSQPILEVADYIGDSYGLSVQASQDKRQNILMCGVRFMAETCKVLCPEKRVYLPNPDAGCPMAEQLAPEGLAALKAQYPDYTVVVYVNTTSALKAQADVCVTSACAVQVCQAIENDKILFIPDPNLGQYVAGQLPDKQFAFYQGGCPHHMQVTRSEVTRARAAHPNALVLVHPECPGPVTDMADYVGSTTGIMAYAQQSPAQEFIIGTEISIVEHLQYQCPDKRFYPLSASLTCANMRLTTLMDVYHCIRGTGGEQIALPAEEMAGAGRCIRRMIALNG